MSTLDSIDRKTAGKILRVSVRTVDRYIRRGKLKAHQYKGRILLNKKEVSAFPQSQKPILIKPTVVRSSSRLPPRRRAIEVSSAHTEDSQFYKDLYEETRRVLDEYQQKLHQSQFRIGQLEAQISQPFGQRHETYAESQLPAHREFARDIADRERELDILKLHLKQEHTGKIVFAILTYLLIGMIPLLWYILRNL